MTTSNTATKRIEASPAGASGHMSLRQLLERVVKWSDIGALKEFHDDRTPFRREGGHPLRLVEFVAALGNTTWALSLAAYNRETLERACDMTIDRFVCLPTERTAGFHAERRTAGVDCRNYFRSFLDQMGRWRRNHPQAHPLEEEAAAARILQRTVVRNFRFSLMEAKRKCNPARSRRSLRVNGAVLYLLMPTHMGGRQCRAWLEAHVHDLDPDRAGEQARIQAIVDQRLGVPRHVPFNEESADVRMSNPRGSAGRPSIEEQISARGLATVVADEKAEDLHKQRPAIQYLGKDALERLIMRVFEDLVEGRYEEKALAEEFRLSRPTFSRFAGSRWRTSVSGRPPDLWANVAQTLANHAAFMEAAEEAGVWPQVEDVLRNCAASRSEGTADAR